MDLFKDKDMTVYTDGARLMSDSANGDMSPLGSLLVDASEFQDAASFSSARSALSRSSLKGLSRSGSGGIQPFQINDIQPERKENAQVCVRASFFKIK